MNNRKNAISSLILQLGTILQGLILPKLILTAFGSEVNGLVSSITQFLSFISLLEGGLGAVVLAALYKPIEEHKDQIIQGILKACQSFFSKLTVVFLVYTFIVAFVYPLLIETSFSIGYIASLTLILSMVTVAQYLFSITYRLLLQAEQRLYIVNCISAVTILINTASAAFIIFFFPDIHIVKFCSGIIYLIQPLVYQHFVEKKFLRNSVCHSECQYVLKNQRSGFSQNLAHFVNMNTDVALITLFMPLQSVSVYAVHLLVINALRGVVSSMGNSYQSALGKYIAQGNIKKLQRKFAKFEEAFWLCGMILFFCCIQLINPFIQIYTDGITDAQYYQPFFSFMLVLANMMYVVREPYRLLVLAGGKFKETNFGAFFEAVLNIGISLVLIQKLGLVGVVIGTFVAITYRLCYLLQYLHREILRKSYLSMIRYVLTLVLNFAINLLVYLIWPLHLNNILQFFFAGCITLILETTFCLFIYYCVKKSICTIGRGLSRVH